jgi:cytochrome oxidase Cu insertion factor (SCO1/SenC/PrrC family)
VKRIFTFVFLSVCAATSRANVVDPAPQRERSIPSINWTDESGGARQLSEFSGYPLILLPIYTRCPGPCRQNVDRLKAALADSSNNPRQFRVLLFSFDPSDNATTLANYRQRENIPLGWSIGAASQTNIDTLLESIGIQVGNAGVEFTHPNIVVFLDSKLRVAKWIYGTAYTGRDVDLALRVASGESDWIGRYAQLLYALLLFAGSVLCVALCYHLMELFALRRSNRTGPGIHPFATDR